MDPVVGLCTAKVGQCLRLRGGISIGRLAKMSGITELPPGYMDMINKAAEAGEGSEDWTSDSSALARWDRMREDPDFWHVDGVTQKQKQAPPAPLTSPLLPAPPLHAATPIESLYRRTVAGS